MTTDQMTPAPVDGRVDGPVAGGYQVDDRVAVVFCGRPDVGIVTQVVTDDAGDVAGYQVHTVRSGSVALAADQVLHREVTLQVGQRWRQAEGLVLHIVEFDDRYPPGLVAVGDCEDDPVVGRVVVTGRHWTLMGQAPS